MRHANRSFVVVTLAAAALLGVACTTNSSVDTNNGVQTTGAGGSGAGATGGTSAAGTGGTSAAGTGGTSSLGGAAGTTSLGGSGGTTSGGAAGTSATGGAGPAAALVRYAHLVPDGPAIDLCFRPCVGGNCNGGSFTDGTQIGPIFAKNGDAGKFYFPGVSLHTEIADGTWQIRVVVGDAKDCATSLNVIADQQKSFVAGHAYTFALVGEVAKGVAVTLSDEPSFPVDGKVGYRVFNGLTQSPPVDFGVLEAGMNFVPLAEGKNIVAFTPSVMVPDQPSTSQPAFIVSGTTTLVATGIGFTSKANEEWSIFLAGTKAGDPTAQKLPQIVRCDENDTTPEAGTNNIATCTYGSM